MKNSPLISEIQRNKTECPYLDELSDLLNTQSNIGKIHRFKRKNREKRFFWTYHVACNPKKKTTENTHTSITHQYYHQPRYYNVLAISIQKNTTK